MVFYLTKVKKLVFENKHLILPFSIVGAMFFFIILSLGVPEEEGPGGCGADVDTDEEEIALGEDTEEFGFKGLAKSQALISDVKINVDTSILKGDDIYFLVISAQNSKGVNQTIETLVFGQSKIDRNLKLEEGIWEIQAEAFGGKGVIISNKETSDIKGKKSEIFLLLENAPYKSPSITFDVRDIFAFNPKAESSTFMFDTIGNPYVDDRKPRRSNYAYRGLSWDYKNVESVCGKAVNEEMAKMDYGFSKAISEDTHLLDGTENVELHFEELFLSKNKGKPIFARINLGSNGGGWDPRRETGDRRVYEGVADGNNTISVDGVIKLVTSKFKLSMITCYPKPLGLCGDRGQAFGIGTAEIDIEASDPKWIAEFGSKVRTYFSSITPVRQGCAGTFNATVIVRPWAGTSCSEKDVEKEEELVEKRLDTDGSAKDVALFNSNAYVADGNNGLLVVDSKSMTVVNRLDTSNVDIPNTPASAEALFATDQFIYVSDLNNGLLKVDREKLKIVGHTSRENLGGYGCTHIAISGDFAYLGCGPAGVVKVDTKDMTVKGRINLDNKLLVGRRHVSGQPKGIAIFGEYLYIASEAYGLAKVDKTNMTEVGRLGFVDGAATSVAASDGFALVMVHNAGLLKVDTESMTATKEMLSNQSEYNYGWAIYMKIIGNFAYATYPRGGNLANRILKVNINDVSLVGQIETTPNAVRFALSEKFIYIADESNGLLKKPIESIK